MGVCGQTDQHRLTGDACILSTSPKFTYQSLQDDEQLFLSIFLVSQCLETTLVKRPDGNENLDEDGVFLTLPSQSPDEL